MMRFLLLLIMLPLGLMAQSTDSLAADSVYYPKQRILVFGEPSVLSKKFEGIDKGERVLLIKRLEDGWVYIKYKGKNYYCPSASLTINPDYKSPETNTSNSSSPSYTPSRTIQTGPRGGRYYINKNGNKTYIKRK